MENDKIFTLNQYIWLLNARAKKSSNWKPEASELRNFSEVLVGIKKKFIFLVTEDFLDEIFAFNTENKIKIKPLIYIMIDRVTGTYKSNTKFSINNGIMNFEQNGTCKGHDSKTKF